jgi:hypothetical protein
MYSRSTQGSRALPYHSRLLLLRCDCHCRCVLDIAYLTLPVVLSARHVM